MADTILFVDDEPHVLQSIQRQFRKRFSIKIAGGGIEALQILKTEGPFAVIVSDMRMPGMSGLELLAKVKDFYPETVRLMLTGNADQETAIEAVNTGQIFRFLTKPCPPSLFITSLALAQRQHRLIIAEKELLQQTLIGCINVMSQLLGMAKPAAFSSALRIKKYVVQIAESLELPAVWQFEAAALLSQIGCITIPSDILNKIYAGHKLSVEEQDLYSNHLINGAQLLKQIPRLEVITQMISMQQMRYDEYTDDIMQSTVEDIAIGAQILKAAVDLDLEIYRGTPQNQALQYLQGQTGHYNPKVLAALSSIQVEREVRTMMVRAADITVGMVADENIMTKNGVLIIPKGQEFTSSLIQGILNFASQVGVLEPFAVQTGMSALPKAHE